MKKIVDRIFDFAQNWTVSHSDELLKVTPVPKKRRKVIFGGCCSSNFCVNGRIRIWKGNGRKN